VVRIAQDLHAQAHPSRTGRLAVVGVAATYQGSPNPTQRPRGRVPCVSWHCDLCSHRPVWRAQPPPAPSASPRRSGAERVASAAAASASWRRSACFCGRSFRSSPRSRRNLKARRSLTPRDRRTRIRASPAKRQRQMRHPSRRAIAAKRVPRNAAAPRCGMAGAAPRDRRLRWCLRFPSRGTLTPSPRDRLKQRGARGARRGAREGRSAACLEPSLSSSGACRWAGDWLAARDPMHAGVNGEVQPGTTFDRRRTRRRSRCWRTWRMGGGWLSPTRTSSGTLSGPTSSLCRQRCCARRRRHSRIRRMPRHLRCLSAPLVPLSVRADSVARAHSVAHSS
jgi:hypothetical protein